MINHDSARGEVEEEDLFVFLVSRPLFSSSPACEERPFHVFVPPVWCACVVPHHTCTHPSRGSLAATPSKQRINFCVNGSTFIPVPPSLRQNARTGRWCRGLRVCEERVKHPRGPLISCCCAMKAADSCADSSITVVCECLI